VQQAHWRARAQTFHAADAGDARSIDPVRFRTTRMDQRYGHLRVRRHALDIAHGPEGCLAVGHLELLAGVGQPPTDRRIQFLPIAQLRSDEVFHSDQGFLSPGDHLAVTAGLPCRPEQQTNAVRAGHPMKRGQRVMHLDGSQQAAGQAAVEFQDALEFRRLPDRNRHRLDHVVDRIA